MLITDKRLQRCVLHEQEILLPDEEAWKELERDPNIGDTPVFKEGSLAYFLAVTRHYPEVSLAIYDQGASKLGHGKSANLTPLHLMRIDQQWIRVEVGSINCLLCDWHGYVAEVSAFEIYMGANCRKAMESAPYMQFVCPKCNLPSPREMLVVKVFGPNKELNGIPILV